MANFESLNEAAARIQLSLKVKRTGEIEVRQERGVTKPGTIGSSKEVTDALIKSSRGKPR